VIQSSSREKERGKEGRWGRDGEMAVGRGDSDGLGGEETRRDETRRDEKREGIKKRETKKKSFCTGAERKNSVDLLLDESSLARGCAGGDRGHERGWRGGRRRVCV